jgi:hypothetical protein
VQFSHHQVDVGYTETNMKKGISLQGYELQQYYSKNGIIRLKLIHNPVTEFLRYNLYETVK